MVTMRLLRSMELWLANTFLPLLLLTWLPVGAVSQLVQPGSTVQFEICLENLTVQVKWCKPECLEGENQTNTVILGENCMNFTSSSPCTAHTGICACRVFITRPNLTDTGNSTQAAVHCCGCAEPPTDVTGKIWTGELMSGEVAERNQVNMAAPVTGTEDLTYANLNFGKKETGPASSNVIYTEIKPSQQKQSAGDGSAASTEMYVSSKEEGK
ncbi:uncharacterized protein LOC131582621 isoform X2 [Poecile atricapillus]|uniref:uncharacterized protein LOC131582621 isoform X2 n=1 Tax=Poecile atricapillus TaxID=48891 RepID=UPI00273A030F|nr:uncharacterized protein LOC131582621 isoform X2 [Poecile atricapillus]